MIHTEMLFIVDDDDPYRGTLYVTVTLDGTLIAECEEQRVFTEDTLYMMTHEPTVKAHMLREYSGVIKLHWNKYTVTDLVFSVYLDCSTVDWWRLLQATRIPNGGEDYGVSE